MKNKKIVVWIFINKCNTISDDLSLKVTLTFPSNFCE